MNGAVKPNAAKILDGLEVSAAVLTSVHDAIEAHVGSGGHRPGLAVVLLGDDPASSIYVRAKRKDCELAGIQAKDFDLPAETSQVELLDLIDELNRDDEIQGVLVQLPLPPHIDEVAVTNAISASKDVDGFHAFNVGRLALRQPGLRPCTARGIMTLLNYYGIKVMGRHCVVVGASNIVGRPMGLELLYQGATVTTCHRFTENLEFYVRQAEVLIIAVGKRGVVDADWIAEGAMVVDVGINRLDSGKLVGDIDFERAAAKAAWISPVPGGVGPMTRATLMQNTAEAAGIDIPEPKKP
ncbi:MAG: bifunctional methylenetetrahydrofolate dehydrogenase/methenyltetrahydrofolate cyclohydrolase FolD [Gammaproteobacteria bacterium]|nr:MAG: bifunctional methylenetetrahydrofolate dehydrogenase/methenyltetrahydrofolate cyclohydrolase FolD [Gammaproteobacteria bacterium]